MLIKRRITIMTFGFKYGLPSTNNYFDVSFAKNPAREEQWSLFDEPDDAMIEFVLSQPSVGRFIDSAIPLINTLIDLDDDVRIGIGCNAGRHRSIIIAEEIGKKLRRNDLEVDIIHREKPYR